MSIGRTNFKKGDIVFFGQEHSVNYSCGKHHFKLDKPYIVMEVFVTNSVVVREIFDDKSTRSWIEKSKEAHYILDSYKLIKIRDYNLIKILN